MSSKININNVDFCKTKIINITSSHSLKEKKMRLQESIIEAVGQVYNYLAENGEVTTKKMQKDLSLDDNFTSLSLGWLAREDKVAIEKRGAYTKVSLI